MNEYKTMEQQMKEVIDKLEEYDNYLDETEKKLDKLETEK